MKLVVGLGNPGVEYKKTRHNVGFMVIDSLANDFNIEINKKKFDGLYNEIMINNQKVILLKPQKYMNLSGEVIIKFIDYYKINLTDVLIVHDDLDLNVGKFKLKTNGSSGGHNGLKNIALNIQSDTFNRLKIGISNNKDIETKDYVLGQISEEEDKIINETIKTCKEIVIDFVDNDMITLMNRYNRK